ncbi:MAG: beta-ketoacyl-[acyl-carrier-protein] synthase family protein [Planctomycetaceae bacterium]|nr:beta-ketoacyl-[acyl-carrier-protein] synthase family protein [Planctomycetaceae bacterium]
MSTGSRRVVVSGLGVVTPLGADCATTWGRLIAEKSGLVRLPDDHLADIPQFDGRPIPPGVLHGGPAPLQKLSAGTVTGEPIIDLAMHAAREAVEDAGGSAGFDVDPYRAGVVFGTSKGGLRSFDRFVNRTGGLKSVESVGAALRSDGDDDEAGRFWQQFLSDTPALTLSERYGFQASAHCPVAACATGLVAIQRAAEMIQQGQCDVMIAGSSDASLLPALQSSFHRLGVLARNFENPATACRPFDETREGFLVGEGAAVLILEEAERARARGVTPYAEWLGGMQVADTAGLTQLQDDSPALQHLLRQLPVQCGFEWRDVSYLNLHGTGTVMNDACEAGALTNVLGDEVERVPASSLKGSLGHLLGASGSVETALTLLALKYQRFPGNPTLEMPFEGCRLNLIRDAYETICPDVVVKLSLGFGGHLAAGAFRAWR